MARFASPEHQALARLLCLGDAYDYDEGRSVCDAFDTLTLDERGALTRWLNSDGLSQRPGYVLCGATRLLQHAKNNPAVGLPAALRMLLRVQEECVSKTEQLPERPNVKVMVQLGELASWAKDAGPDPDAFLGAVLSIQSENQATLIHVGVSQTSWAVDLPQSLRPAVFRAVGTAESRATCARRMKVAALLAWSTLSVGLAVYIFLSDDAGSVLLVRTGLERKLVLGALGIMACVPVLIVVVAVLGESSRGSGEIRDTEACSSEVRRGTVAERRHPLLTAFDFCSPQPHMRRRAFGPDYSRLSQNDDDAEGPR